MKIEKITYQETFPTGEFRNKKYGMEITLHDGDLVEDAYAKAETICQETFKKLNPHIGEVQWTSNAEYKVGESHYDGGRSANYVADETPQFVTKDPKEKRIDAFIDVINSYNNKEGLIKNMMKLVDKENIPRLTEAFNKKLEGFA